MLAEAVQHVSVLSDYWHTATDPAHIGAEITWTILFDIGLLSLGIPALRRWVKRHDKDTHGVSDKEGTASN